jgi:hypothetical protein
MAAMNRPETHRRRRIELADELGSAVGWQPRILDFLLYGPWIARRRGGGWILGSVEGSGGGGFGRWSAGGRQEIHPDGHRLRPLR